MSHEAMHPQLLLRQVVPGCCCEHTAERSEPALAPFARQCCAESMYARHMPGMQGSACIEVLDRLGAYIAYHSGMDTHG